MTTKTNFRSPINADDGLRHMFLGNADSEMELFVSNPDSIDGYLYWEYKFVDGERRGEEEVRRLHLYFHKKTLIAFYGVFELPDQAIRLLEENGYNADIAKL